MNKEQNEVSHSFLKGSDLGEREQEVLKDVQQRTGFLPKRLLSRSSWWTATEIGAFHYMGTYNCNEAVLKVQGVRPAISEIDMINSFSRTNKSPVLRPPHLYASLPWDDEKRYEALLLEAVDGPKVIQSPTTQGEVNRFFALYQDYRANCLQSPWIERPKTSLSARVAESFAKWQRASVLLYPDHPLRRKEDSALIEDAVAVLSKDYRDVEPEFQHGHFSAIDLCLVGVQVVLFSNLYWSWRLPLYDAVFGYHWHIYSLASVPGITPEVVETQRAIWLNTLQAFLQSQRGTTKLLTLALLERATAGLNLDVLSIDPQQPIASHLVVATRDQVKLLLHRAKTIR